MREAIGLFCLPHSGATAQGYLRWAKALPSWIDVRPVETPGRGARSGETPRTDLVGLAEDLAAEIAPRLGPSYALFGHSLGAILAFEVAHALIAGGSPAPLRLFVSASAAPSLRDDRERATPMSDMKLVDELRRLGGTPEEALADPDLMALVLPALRADFLMSGGYVHRPRAPLPCPITALGGDRDDVTAEAVAGWADETSAGFDMRLFAGGHFFIHERERETLDLVVAGLMDAAGARVAA